MENTTPKDKFSLEQDLACAASEYAYENGDADFEFIAKIKMTNQGATAEIIDGFTLTAKEVDIVRQALLTEKNVVIDIHCKFPAIDAYIIPARDKINNLLTRIKQWQDEQGKGN